MNIAIVSNLKDGIGLYWDFILLRDFLTEEGHDVAGIQWDEPFIPDVKPDLAIFLEVIPRDKLCLAERRWAFLNPEWCKREVIDTANLHCEKIFAKTKEAKRIFDKVFPGKVHYTGFLARDQYDEVIPRKPEFLHIGGNSSLRGTQAVLDAWKWNLNGTALNAKLHLVSTALKDRPELPNVCYYERVSEEKLKNLQNSCLFHLHPAGTEGYGHTFHESLSVGAFIVTTEAPPMNEVQSCYRIKPCSRTTYNLANVYDVSALDVYNAVNDLQKLWNRYHQNFFHPRDEFLAQNAVFKKAFEVHLDGLTKETAPYIPKKEGSLQIAFLGNFEAPESTENMVLWALEEGLGHAVWKMQENKISINDLEVGGKTCDLFLWVRTPGWLQIGDQIMHQFLAYLKSNNVPSVSLHLDKFWDIPEREKQIGLDAFWKSEFVFTADGSRQTDFLTRGVNHIWMPPAVSEVYCHPGTPRDEYRCDVAFVGARGYHKEHPFREQLVDFLETTYGADFKHITNLRGHGLNDFYASAKIVVGDCFGGGKIPFYWSDRVPETIGRGGFLLHPRVEGLDEYIECPWFKPMDLESLREQIDYWLSHEEKRIEFKRSAMEQVRDDSTWTARMGEVLDEVYGQVRE